MKTQHWLPATLISISLAVLVACGANEGQNTPLAAVNTGSLATNSIAVSSADTADAPKDSALLKSLTVLYPNGKLPAERAAQAAQDRAQNPAALQLTAETAPVLDVNPQAQAQTTGVTFQPQAVAADYQPVQRIQNTTLYGAYFFSIYPGEVTTALATNPNWRLEGPAFWASLATGTDLHPVHRFRNLNNGSYLYTIFDSERADIVANYSATFIYEGPAWHARQTAATGWSALYRFRNVTNGTYLFSAYESERDAILRDFPTVFTLEGPAYYVRQDAPIDPPVVPPFKYKLPDTGITSSQCYKAGSNVLSSCAFSLFSGTAYDLNFYQDGMVGLDKTAPAAADGKLGFSYSEVPNPAGGNFPKADCVKDNLTGLVWESKTILSLNIPSPRPASSRYTNVGTNAPGDASGFAAAVNATSLCGYTDWRLPTAAELQSIVDYGVAFPGPTIDSTWFPITWDAQHWSSSLSSGSSSFAWTVDFRGGASLVNLRSQQFAIRLVRGTTVNSQYTISANGQEVTDSKTGLIWRRCSEGQTSTVSSCVGAAAPLTHEQALAQATSQTFATNVGWRLPNIKELASIADKTKIDPAIDTAAFPATSSFSGFWASTPYVGSASLAWTIEFYAGEIFALGRQETRYVRLVRAGQ